MRRRTGADERRVVYGDLSVKEVVAAWERRAAGQLRALRLGQIVEDPAGVSWESCVYEDFLRPVRDWLERRS